MPHQVMIVRHGEAYNTVAPDGVREVRDRANPPLTARGEEQARAVAEVVAAFGPDAVVVSPFLRVAQTALRSLRLLSMSGTFDLRMCEEFVYSSLTAFDGVDAEHYASLLGPLLPVTGEMSDRRSYPAYPESPESVRARVASLAEGWLTPDGPERIVFFGHGATVRGLMQHLDPSLGEDAPEPGHCSVTRMIELPGGGWTASLLADQSHLTPRGAGDGVPGAVR